MKEFERLKESNNKDIFAELCFCLLTPQSKAIYCDRAVEELKKSGLLFKGDRRAIRNKLKGVRFPNNKASYIAAARKSLADIRAKLDANNAFKARDWLVRNIKGLGYKEASHFLRNIGLGGDMAILDVHILRSLLKYKIVKKVPKNLTRARYLSIEDKIREFSKKVKILMEELDLLFWSAETGFVFK